MEIKSTINIVLRDLAEARELIDDLRNYPGVPLLQVELAKAKCKSAEDVIRLLSELSNEPLEKSHREAGGTAVADKEDKAVTGGQIESGEDKTDGSGEPGSPMEVIGGNEEVIGRDEEVAIDREVTEKEIEAEQGKKISKVVDAIVNFGEKEPVEGKKEKAKEKKIVADNFSGLSQRINEQIGDQKKEGPSSSQLSRPLTDLTREIGINDRFYFIREVFDGKQDEYMRVISDLNKVDNMEEAIKIIKDGTAFDPGDEPVQLLLDLVKRKISSSRHE